MIMTENCREELKLIKEKIVKKNEELKELEARHQYLERVVGEADQPRPIYIWGDLTRAIEEIIEVFAGQSFDMHHISAELRKRYPGLHPGRPSRFRSLVRKITKRLCEKGHLQAKIGRGSAPSIYTKLELTSG